jgi:hypothetical protein
MTKQTQKTKFFKKLKNIGFKKVITDDGLVMYQITSRKINQQKETK